MKRWMWPAALAALPALTAGCDALGGALTGHSRPAAEAAGVRLPAGELGRVMAVGTIPDTALTPYWAGQVATLWADYVRLAALYTSPDSTLSLDYDPLLEGQRYYDALAVARYRDSVVLRGLEPTEAEVRRFFETRQPFTRLDVRRIRLPVPEEAPEEVRDSVFAAGEEARRRIQAGADFVEVARERSDEPLAARGLLLGYQGHDDFPPAADTIVYRLRPGEVTPPIATADAVLLYRVERRIEPEYEKASDRTRRLMVEERSEEASLHTQDTLIGNARPAVLDGAVHTARRIATDMAMEEGRVPPGARLVSFRGGEVSAHDLRLLFQVRDDIRQLFAQASDEEAEAYLYELARDEILVNAARRHGLGPTEEERRELREALAAQVAAIARQLGLSHNLVIAPGYDPQLEGLAFLERTVRRGRHLPWLGGLRPLLDPAYPARVHRRGAETAARVAADLRAEAAAAGDTPAAPPGEAEAAAAGEREGGATGGGRGAAGGS